MKRVDIFLENAETGKVKLIMQEHTVQRARKTNQDAAAARYWTEGTALMGKG